MATFLLTTTGLAIAGSIVESKYIPKNTDGPFGLSTYFGLTPLVFCIFNFFVLSFGMRSGQARRKYTEQATKDGEKDVEDRYGLPNLYAQGTTKNAKAFNCVQRAHQHIFESLTQVMFASVVAAISYPVTAGVASLLYAIGRFYTSKGYAEGEGDASKRFKYGILGRFMYRGLLINFLLGIISSIKMITGGKFIW